MGINQMGSEEIGSREKGEDDTTHRQYLKLCHISRNKRYRFRRFTAQYMEFVVWFTLRDYYFLSSQFN